jgi:hypothetical protein
VDRLSAPTLPVPSVRWGDHAQYLADNWVPRETPHISIISPTRNGKTVLLSKGILAVLAPDDRCLILDAKGDDKTLNALPYRPIRSIPKAWQRKYQARGNDAPPPHFRMVIESRDQVSEALATCVAEGDWTIVMDEGRYVCDPMTTRQNGLGLAGQVDDIWVRCGGKGVCMVALTQAPRFMPASFYEQASHLYLGATLDKRAIKRLSEIGGDTDRIEATVRNLPRYHYLYIGPLTNSGRREMHTTKVELL